MSLEHTIQRDPHDGEHPFAQINRALIRDETISPECRWLLIYLLSMKDGWVISIKQIWSHVTPHMGRAKVYAIIKEAINAGYMKREETRERNLIKGVKYFVSESPRYSNNFSAIPISGIPSVKIPKTDTHKKSIGEEEHSEELMSEVQAPSDVRDSPPPKNLPKEASEMSDVLFAKVKEVHPKVKPPKLDEWSKVFDLMNRKDNRSWDEIKDMINWIFNDDFWFKIIQSPDGLRRNWDKMAAKRSSYSNKSTTAKRNREIAQEIKNHLKKSGRENILWIGNDYVSNNSTNEKVNLDTETQIFESILIKWFGLKKV